MYLPVIAFTRKIMAQSLSTDDKNMNKTIPQVNNRLRNSLTFLILKLLLFNYENQQKNISLEHYNAVKTSFFFSKLQ